MQPDRADQWHYRAGVILLLVALCCLPLVGCEDTAAPVLPSKIEIVDGDGQYSKRGTELENPLQVRLRYENGSLASGFDVRFQVVELGGTLSAHLVRVNDAARASTRLTLPDTVGTVLVRASVEGNEDLNVVFTATSAEFYCPEENPEFTRKFGTANSFSLFLFTSRSVFHDDSGVIRIDWGNGEFAVSNPLEFPGGGYPHIPRDIAFSRSGDLFVAMTYGASDDVVEIAPNFSYGNFSGLDNLISEITTSPDGILVGCDQYGPFVVGCRDTLARFDDAYYDGSGQVANDNAVAVDPVSGDIYYIVYDDPSGANASLMRLDDTGTPAPVVDLTATEAQNAKGMEVDGTDGAVYILVDATNTKAIVRVTAAGVKTSDFVDFIALRGQGDAAGVQSDLAIDRRFRFLFTLDTLNNTLLLYDIPQSHLSELTPTNTTDPEALSTDGDSGERVGLAVLP
jgi:hypothetical protein